VRRRRQGVCARSDTCPVTPVAGVGPGAPTGAGAAHTGFVVAPPARG